VDIRENQSDTIVQSDTKGTGSEVKWIELDFLIQHFDVAKTILECKYQSELTEKQRELFDKTVAEKIMTVISN